VSDVTPLFPALAPALDYARPPLFQTGTFKLAAGQESDYKIECEALGDEDWAGLAHIAVKILPPFHQVTGVPRGGFPFAQALRAHVTEPPFDEPPVLLVADDVWTTGRTMKRYKTQYVTTHIATTGQRYSKVVGIVAFARCAIDGWVRAVFYMAAHR
jgi:hypothetical protein